VNPARIASIRARSEARYELLEPIATGGMAVIRRGFDRWAQREIAHKRLRVDRELVRPRLSALFAREYDTLARLEHPNIVEVYDYGFDAQGPYYAMELLSGADLSKIAPLPYPEACRILRDVASALALLHARRFLHRDVSPNNVRLTSAGVAKLIDFGTLAMFGRPPEIAGTPAFIAPECVEEVDLDQRTDLYSLGALAYWTLTGRCAVNANSIAELPDAWREPLIPAAQHVLGLPPALDELIAALLCHDRARRPGSAAEVIEQLTTIAGLAPEHSERKVAYSYLKHPPLVGRSEALSTLRRALETALDGRGGIAIIEGMAGLGRSALLDQLSVDAQLHGATVLRAEGSGAAGAHGVARRLVQLGARVYPDLDGSEAFRRQLLELDSPSNNGARHPAEAMERNAVAAGRLRKLLLQLSERGPLAILLDDADRADTESLGLLASMAEELPRHPIFLLMTVRERVDESVLAYERLARGASKIVLANLEEAQLIELVQNMFGAVPNAHRTALWLHHETGGNPGQCLDLLRLLLQRGAIRYTRGTFALPHDVHGDLARDRRSNALLTRLSGLGSEALRVVELLSLHLGSLTAQQLAQASGLSARDVVLSVEQLVQRGVAFFTADSASLRGESLRAVVEHTIDAERKRGLHLALANAVESDDGAPMARELARTWHLFRSGEQGEQQAADKMVQLLAIYRHEVSMSPGTVPLLEAALAVYERRGASDVECSPLLAALSVTGFYGDLGAQRKYLRRALAALSQQSGMTLASKLTRWLGTPLALWIGLLWATLFAPLFPRLLGRLSIKRRIEELLTACGCGMATAATVYDLDTAREIERHLLPIAGFPLRTAPGYARSFCLATGNLIAFQSRVARDAYVGIVESIRGKVFLLDERLREQLRLGVLNGWAHAEVEQPHGVTLALADELERSSSFFAAHAETVRMLYHAIRGANETAEGHRVRAELLALRGGVSWTAATILAVRSLEAAAFTRDTVTLERSVAELDRLSRQEPSLGKYGVLARARLALARNQPGEAHDLLVTLIGGAHERSTAVHAALAEALNELGRFAEAKAHCLLALADLDEAQQRFSSALRLPYLQLARADTGLGQHELAREQLVLRSVDAELRGNPLELGALEREFALIALAARDRVAFELHCRAMAGHFGRTQQPNLLRQQEELWTRAVALGLRAAPSMNHALTTSAGPDPLDGETHVESRAPSRVPPQPK